MRKSLSNRPKTQVAGRSLAVNSKPSAPLVRSFPNTSACLQVARRGFFWSSAISAPKRSSSTPLSPAPFTFRGNLHPAGMAPGRLLFDLHILADRSIHLQQFYGCAVHLDECDEHASAWTVGLDQDLLPLDCGF